MADQYDPADYRFVAEHFWHVESWPETYTHRWRTQSSALLETIPFRGIGLGTIYLAVAWLETGAPPRTVADIARVGVTLAAIEKICLAMTLLIVFHVVRRRWGTVAAFAALALTALPPHHWRATDDFIAEPVERIIFLLAFSGACAMTDRVSAWRGTALLVALFTIASLVKVQWFVAAILIAPAIWLQLNAEGARPWSSVLLAAAIALIPLTILGVNWVGWRTASLAPGVGLHINLKYDGDVLRAFTRTVAGHPDAPAFTDPTRPAHPWWHIYLGPEVRREDYLALDRYARRYLRRHAKLALHEFWTGLQQASTVPAVEHVEERTIRLQPLGEPWHSLVRGLDLAVWGLLVAGLWHRDTRLICALGLALWIVPALGHVVSLDEARYHEPMAGIGAIAGVLSAIRLFRASRTLRVLVPSTAVAMNGLSPKFTR